MYNSSMTSIINTIAAINADPILTEAITNAGMKPRLEQVIKEAYSVQQTPAPAPRSIEDGITALVNKAIEDADIEDTIDDKVRREVEGMDIEDKVAEAIESASRARYGNDLKENIVNMVVNDSSFEDSVKDEIENADIDGKVETALENAMDGAEFSSRVEGIVEKHIECITSTALENAIAKAMPTIVESVIAALVGRLLPKAEDKRQSMVEVNTLVLPGEEVKI
jgi:uncharacterized membrane-anchored protein YjiN (DUF445 family)